MVSSAGNSNSFTSPTIPWSSVIPTQWRSISGRVSIVKFGDGTSAFCWLEQRWLAPTDYQFTLSLVSPGLFPPSFFIFYFFILLLLIFNLFTDFFLPLSSVLFSISFVSSFFSFFSFYFTLSLLISFQLSYSPLGLFLIWVCVPVMSIDSKFVFEFIAWVMVIIAKESRIHYPRP